MVVELERHAMASEFDRALAPTPTVDSNHPTVVAFARHHTSSTAGTREAAVALYCAIRDGLRYDPYAVSRDVASLRASTTLAAGRGWCVSKAVVLVASCRAVGVPARLGFADVRNHLSTERLRASMGTDVFYWHGYASLRIDGRWVKATPAFNLELCERFRLRPLEFDGREDSLYHAFDLEDRRHMEYVHERGEFDDVPFQEMMATFRLQYGAAIANESLAERDFDREVEEEARR